MKKETTKYPNKGMNSLAKKNPKVAKKIMGYKDGGKVEKVMREFKKGELNIGKSKKKVKSRKQAIAIALAEAGMSKKRKMKS